MESLKITKVLPLDDDTQVSVARRAAAAMAERLGLSAEAVSRAELIVVELAGNILHHATRGTLYLGATPEGNALQIIAADRGPGIGNVALALEDGFSTRSTPGLGLGAVRRLLRGNAAELGIYSQPGAGTVVSAIVGEAFPVRANSGETVAVLSSCIEGEILNGDCWGLHRTTGRDVYLVVDGLGHGLYAAEASALAIRLVKQALADDPAVGLSALLTQLHGPMRATRGAAVAVISVAGAQATCCGVGNISVSLHSPDGSTRTGLSHNGTLGHQMRKVQEFTLSLSPETTLVMHSDGLATHWKMGKYPGLLAQPPATIAGVLYRDAVRGRDDATVLVARLLAAPAATATQSSQAVS